MATRARSRLTQKAISDMTTAARAAPIPVLSLTPVRGPVHRVTPRRDREATTHGEERWVIAPGGGFPPTDASGQCRITGWRKAAVRRLAALGLALVRSESRPIASSRDGDPHGQALKNQPRSNAVHRAAHDRARASQVDRAAASLGEELVAGGLAPLPFGGAVTARIASVRTPVRVLVSEAYLRLR